MIVVVSPHFDDGVGSCGGMIHHLVKKGEFVQILTVFAGHHGHTEVSEFAKVLLKLWKITDGVSERILENAEACRRLGAEDVNLPFVEALYRKTDGRWLYPNDGDLFREIQPEDDCLPLQIAETVMGLYERDVHFYFPGGSGNHVDHLLVRRAGEILVQFGYTVLLYKDFSYIGAVERRIFSKENRIFLDQDDFNAKVNAMNAYTSQLLMLFESCDSRKYFISENTEGDQIYELYYCIPKCENNGDNRNTAQK